MPKNNKDNKDKPQAAYIVDSPREGGREGPYPQGHTQLALRWLHLKVLHCGKVVVRGSVLADVVGDGTEGDALLVPRQLEVGASHLAVAVLQAGGGTQGGTLNRAGEGLAGGTAEGVALHRTDSSSALSHTVHGMYKIR